MIDKGDRFVNIEIRYCSRNGRNQEMAQLLATELTEIAKKSGDIVAEIVAKSIDTSIDNQQDVLFLGGGVYLAMLDGRLKRFLRALDKAKIRLIVSFGMATKTNSAKKICKFAKGLGFECEEGIFIKKATEQSETEKEIKTFALAILEKIKQKIEKEKNQNSENQNETDSNKDNEVKKIMGEQDNKKMDDLVDSIEMNAEIESGSKAMENIQTTSSAVLDLEGKNKEIRTDTANLIDSIQTSTEMESGEYAKEHSQIFELDDQNNYNGKNIETQTPSNNLVDSVQINSQIESGNYIDQQESIPTNIVNNTQDMLQKENLIKEQKAEKEIEKNHSNKSTSNKKSGNNKSNHNKKSK